MAGVTRAVAHLSAEEVLRRWKQNPRIHRRQRWLIMYQALVDPREAAQKARALWGLHDDRASPDLSLQSAGRAAVETPGKGGRRSQYLTLEPEQQFLAPFFAQAQVGTISTAAQIKQAFGVQVGHEVAESTRLTLARPSWLAQAGPASGSSQSRPEGPGHM